MKRFLMTGAGLFALAIATLPASAADIPMARPAPSTIGKAPTGQLFNWSGFYAGLHGGWAWGDAGSVDLEGWFAGGQIGLNMQAPGSPVVWGIEVDSAFADIGDSASIGPFTAKTEADYIGSLRGRVGAAADRTLFYVTGGLAWARNEISASGPGLSASDRKTHWGWTAGAGIEQDFGGGWSGKVEYLYADLRSKDYFGGLISSGDIDLHTVKLGFNYRFGGGKTPGPVYTNY